MFQVNNWKWMPHHHYNEMWAFFEIFEGDHARACVDPTMFQLIHCVICHPMVRSYHS
jgi:hypothetical protein